VVFWTHAVSHRDIPPPLISPAQLPPLSRTAGSEQHLVSIVTQLAPMTLLWRRLLSEHAPAPGGQCRACTQGGTGLLNTPWPCKTYKIAHLTFHYTPRPQAVVDHGRTWLRGRRAPGSTPGSVIPSSATP
jgi:hypothetical protein